MHRQPLLALLDDYHRRFPDETAVVEQTKAFVDAHKDCFSRRQLSGHITGSAWLVSPDDHQVLLTHHRKLNLWVQLGGHADDDPDPLAVAEREAREESGIDALAPVSRAIFDLDVHTIPARGDEPEHQHYDVRFALRADHRLFKVSAESHALAWIDVARLGELTQEDSMLRMAAKWQRLTASGIHRPAEYR